MGLLSKNKEVKETAIEGVDGAISMERPDWMGDEVVDEAMDKDELLLPRIDVAQALSPQLDESEPNYIEGLKLGDLFNTATGEIYGRTLNFVAAQYTKEFLVFQDRAMGGGFGGSYATEDLAMAAIDNLEGEGWEPILALSNLVLILNDDGSVKEMAYMSCTKTKIKAAKKMNTYLKMVRAPRYASVFSLSSSKEEGPKGTYFSFAINSKGWLKNRETFEQAKLVHEQMQGKTVVTEEVTASSKKGEPVDF